jgi:hypothetical protein
MKRSEFLFHRRVCRQTDSVYGSHLAAPRTVAVYSIASTKPFMSARSQGPL